MRFAITAALVLALTCVSADASAGVYTVRACTAAERDVGWASASTGGMHTTASCPATSGDPVDGYAVWSPVVAGTSSNGTNASWRMAAPRSSRILSLTLQRYMRRWSQWSVEIVADNGRVLESCQIPWNMTFCERGRAGGTTAENTVVLGNVGTPAVTFRVSCRLLVGCATSASLPRAVLAIYRADAVIEDSVRPAIGALGGTLITGGWRKGIGTVTMTASDSSGVKSLRVVAASRELGRKDSACDYTRMQPCPGSMTETISFDTAQVPDGTHELKVIAADAADQETEVTNTLRVDRNAPGPPTDVTVTPGDDGTYALSWTSPDQGTASPVVAAHAAVCDAATPPACQPAQRVDVQAGKLALPAGKYALRVWLEDEAGNVDPANAAAVAVDTAVLRSTRVVDTQPPILLPSGPAPSSRIKLTKARRSGSTLTLSGTIARGASARISASVSRTRAGKAVTSGRTTPRRGKWSLKLKLSPSARNMSAMYLTLRFAGQSSFRKTTLKRKLARKARTSGSTAVEFNIETRRR